MMLGLTLIRDILPPGLFDGSGNLDRDQLNLERFELLDARTQLRPGILYLSADGARLPEDGLSAAFAVIFAGRSPVPETLKAPWLALAPGYDLSFLINQISNAFFRAVTLEQQLQDAVSGGQPLQKLLELFMPYFGNSLTVVSTEHHMLAELHPPSITREILDQMPVTDDSMIPVEIVNRFNTDADYVSVGEYRKPFLFRTTAFPWRVLCMNLIYADSCVARVCVSENIHPLRWYDDMLLTILSYYCQQLYTAQLECSSGSQPQRDIRRLLLEMLGGQPAKPQELSAALNRVNWSPSDRFVAAALRPGTDSPQVQSDAYFARQINTVYKGCIALPWEENILVLINLSYYRNDLSSFVSAHIESIRDSFFRIGFSQAFSDLSELCSYYRQGCIALEYGEKRDGMIWLHYFDDYALSYLSDRMTGELDARHLCAPEVRALVQYDRENGGNLCRTLQVYLEHHMNAVQSAAALYIHRATMNYRLGRIQQLTGLNYDDPGRVLWVLLSLRQLFPGQEANQVPGA